MFIKPKKQLLLFAAILTFLMASVQTVFIGIQAMRSEDTSKVIEGVLRNEFSEGNPYYLSNSLKDFENLGIIECSKLENVKQKIQYSNLQYGKDCSITPLLLDGLYFTRVYKTLGGEEWRIEYNILNTKEFYVFLWIIRLFVMIFSLIIYKFYIEKLIKNSLLIELENQTYKEKEKYMDLATQVAHDIKSPLAALEIVMDDIKELPEESRELTVNAINRIQEIANNLSKDGQDQLETTHDSCALISYDVMAILKEKQLEFQNKTNLKIQLLDHTNHMHFIHISSTEISRVISNLINNAAEALSYSGFIQVELSHVDEMIKLIIKDDGSGFPKSMLNLPIKRGNTIGKENGQGLGLHHAYETILQAGGEFKIYNDNGAVVEILLPEASPPTWFNSDFEFYKYSKIYIIDDDRSIHDLWKRVFKTKNIKTEIIHLQNKMEIEDGMQTITDSDLVLIDHDLRLPKSGIDFICEFHFKNVLLVTSGYEQAVVQQFCIENKVPLLPKYLIGYL